MPAIVHKLGDNIDYFREALKEIHELKSEELAKEIEKEGKRLLNLTLEQRRSRSGFARAQVVADKEIISTEKGCITKIHFLVSDGIRHRPHKKWHIINNGREPFVAKDNTRFRVTKSPRTGPKGGIGKRQLEVRSFGGKGGWVTIKKGRSYGKIEGRHFYAEVTARLKKNLLRKKRFNLIEVTTFEANNG